MNTLMIVFIFVSLLFGGVTYFVTTNYFFAIGVLIVSILYFVFLAIPKLNKGKIKTTRFHQCYHFINTYIISLSVKQSIKAAYEDTLNTMDDDFKKIDSGLEDLIIEEKLNYLLSVYPFHIYSLFLNIINLWTEQGGDILNMSSQLINETRNVEDYLLASERLSKKKYIEFTTLWLIAISILIFLKFALKEFYSKLVNQIFFPISISMIFLFILVSIDILLNVTTNLELKGWRENEKKS